MKGAEMSWNEIKEKWKSVSEADASRLEQETNAKILEIIEDEFEWSAEVVNDEEWDALFDDICERSEGFSGDLKEPACKAFAALASNWADNDHYGIDPTIIDKWLPKARV